MAKKTPKSIIKVSWNATYHFVAQWILDLNIAIVNSSSILEFSRPWPFITFHVKKEHCVEQKYLFFLFYFLIVTHNAHLRNYIQFTRRNKSQLGLERNEGSVIIRLITFGQFTKCEYTCTSILKSSFWTPKVLCAANMALNLE